MKTTTLALAVLTLSFGMGLGARSASAQCAAEVCTNNSVTIGNDQATLECVRYDYPGAGQSTWYYTISSGSGPAISHVNFSLNLDCMSILDAGIWGPGLNHLNSGGGDPEIRFSPDPTTGVIGLKFDEEFDDGESRNYYFTLDGNYQQSEMMLIVTKGGPGFDGAMICGPSADCLEIADCPGPCEAPENITVTQLTPRSVLIEWDDDECAAGWRICAREMGTGAKVCHIRTGSEKVFYNLTPGNTYHFAVRTNCLDGSKSPWSAPVSYTVPTLRLEAPAIETWSLFPNPASSQVNVSWTEGAQQVQIRVQDITGALQANFEMEAKGAAGQHSISTQNLTDGMYFVTIIRDGQVESRHLTIQH